MGDVRFSIGATPNPNSVRVALTARMFAKPATYATAAAAETDPLAKKLFAVKGVTQVFMLNDFISINKDPGVEWGSVEPAVAAVLKEHFGG